jgi:hypothetical protein
MLATALPSFAELDDLATVAFRRPSFRSRTKTHHRFPFLCHFQSQLTAAFRFTIKRLSNGRRTTYLAEDQNVHLKITGVSFDLQGVVNPDLAGRLCRLIVALNPSKFTCACRQGSRLEKSGSPKPLVYADARHLLFFDKILAVASCIEYLLPWQFSFESDGLEVACAE